MEEKVCSNFALSTVSKIGGRYSGPPPLVLSLTRKHVSDGSLSRGAAAFFLRATDEEGTSSMSRMVGHAFEFMRYDASVLVSSLITDEVERIATDLETSTIIRTVTSDACRLCGDGDRMHTGMRPAAWHP